MAAVSKNAATLQSGPINATPSWTSGNAVIPNGKLITVFISQWSANSNTPGIPVVSTPAMGTLTRITGSDRFFGLAEVNDTRISVHVGIGTGANEAFTVTGMTDTTTNNNFFALAWDNTATGSGGTAAIRQSVVGDGSGATITATLGALRDAESMAVGIAVGNFTMTATTSGATQDQQSSVDTENSIQHKSNATVLTWSEGGGGDLYGYSAFEIVSGLAATQKTQTGKSRVKRTTQKTQTGKASLRLNTGGQPGHARITKKTLRTQAGKASIGSPNERFTPYVGPITGSPFFVEPTQDAHVQLCANSTAEILGLVTKRLQTGHGRIAGGIPKTQFGKARISIKTLKTQPGRARVTIKTLRTQTGVAHVFLITPKTQLGRARISIKTLRTITGRARVGSTPVLKPVTGHARLTNAALRTITGHARVTIKTLQTQLGRARVTIKTQRLQTGHAAVVIGSATRTQPGKARVRTVVPRTVTGHARVTLAVPKTITGKARMIFTAARTVTGHARLRGTTLRTQLGHAAIKRTTTQTRTGHAKILALSTAQMPQLGRARLAKNAIHTQLGKASIAISLRKTVTGKADILLPDPLTQQHGKSRITNKATKSISGKARIGFTNAYINQSQYSLVMRVWGNVADSGRDVLGNAYRYATTKDKASYVFDNTKAGWMCSPQPSPTAVEALYFDLRQQVLQPDGKMGPGFGLIDAIAISPRTPGVTMHVYYTQANLKGAAPVGRDQWDNLVWTPLNDDFILRHRTTIELPSPLSVTFVKLEFTNLRPLAFGIPSNPALPPQAFYTYPTWVEQQYSNTQIATAVNEWFSLNATPVQNLVLKQITDPVAEFQYKQSQFLTQLALSASNAGAVINDALLEANNQVSIVDPITAQQIYIQTPTAYQNTLLLNVDQSSLLGQMASNRFDTTSDSSTVESSPPGLGTGIPIVSTATNRITESYATLAQTPMKFNQRSRHVYKVQTGQFNNKAYFVGIDEVAFLRGLTTQIHDDAVINDNLADDFFFVSNTWTREDQSQLQFGQSVYLTYEIGDSDVFVSEQVVFDTLSPVKLQGQGGQAINARMFSGPNNTGLEYFMDWDFDLVFVPNQFGTLTNYVSISTLSARLTAPKLALTYKDVGTVIAHALIPSPPTDDAGVVTGVSVPITTAEGKLWDDSTVVFSIAVISSVDNISHSDTGTVTSSGVISAVSVFEGSDTTAVVGVAVASSLNTIEAIDAGTVTGVSQMSASLSALFGEGVFGRPDATFEKLDTDFVDEATTVPAAVGSASAVGSYTPNGGSPTGSP